VWSSGSEAHAIAVDTHHWQAQRVIFFVRTSEVRIRTASQERCSSTNFVFHPFSEIELLPYSVSETRLSLCGVVRESLKSSHVDAALPHVDAP